MIVLVPFYPIGLRDKEDYFKICADASGGRIVPVQNKDFWEILSEVKGRNVHAHGRGFPFPEAAALFAKQSVYTPHFNTVGDKWWTRLVRRFLFNRYDYVIAQTEFNRRSLIADGVRPEKVVVLPTPLDYQYFSKPSESEAFRKKYGIKKNERFVFAVGARPVKNPDAIVKACKEAGVRVAFADYRERSEVKPGFEWLLPPKEMLNDESVIVTGRLSPESMRAAYGAADVFVNSSSYESFCLAAYEAAAAGVPLCLPQLGTFEGFGDAALLHKPRDHKTLAAHISRYLDDRALARKNASKARAVAKRYDYPIARKALEEFYKKSGMFI